MGEKKRRYADGGSVDEGIPDDFASTALALQNQDQDLEQQKSDNALAFMHHFLHGLTSITPKDQVTAPIPTETPSMVAQAPPQDEPKVTAPFR